MNAPGPIEVLLSLILVGIAIAVGKWWQLPVVKDMALGSVRAFVQLVAVGYALQFIFNLKSLWMILIALLIMMIVGAHAASGRIKGLRGSFYLMLISILTGSLVTLVTMLVTNIITLEARYVIPLAGMIIGNSMNTSALSIDRLVSDIRSNRLAIETALTLGKSWRQASRKYQQDAARTGMISILNFMKTVGIVALPGAMTGMILAGADPLEAVALQIIVGYMILASVTITSIVAVELAVRRFFSRHHQLKYDV